MKKMINEKNLNFPRILCLNEQNDPRPRHQLNRLEAAIVTIGKIHSQFRKSFQDFHEINDDDGNLLKNFCWMLWEIFPLEASKHGLIEARFWCCAMIPPSISSPHFFSLLSLTSSSMLLQQVRIEEISKKL